ncbi:MULTISPECIES: hypothetical protein [Clostridium]|uniref:hypothetical protein n=1 Tax=Clostridium TaxID=1485 RepID=UPI0002FD107D|nr:MULTISPECIES: hypothetical protein [Clostridium]MCD3203070.1 hypothetical protein [Clostridium botulinum C/D]MCD3222764.1 hypothetical protein [Clostridium botulinum C/D]MCD3230961.1 hypothetical protein [Clostridium botulinum C/D]MCD3253262.1 hypothetical protein [Clostridium botulinum C/D]MCD3273538.1 hypothetical protein [Clostridium botulinum C/D]
MKWKIFKWLFRDELLACEKAINSNKLKCEEEIRIIKNELSEEKKQYDLVKRIFSDNKTSKIVGLETNNAGEEVLVVESMRGEYLDVELYGFSYRAINQHPRIMSTKKRDDEKGITYIHIDDIQILDVNSGNGSILMKYFIEAAKKVNAEYINGWISSVDKDHFDRLEHYYNKFDFEVHFNEEHTSGGIKLNLKRS